MFRHRDLEPVNPHLFGAPAPLLEHRNLDGVIRNLEQRRLVLGPHTGRRPRGRSRGAATWLIGAVVAAVAAIAVIVLMGGMGADDDAPEAESVAHVHGLGIDPTDGALHVATHNGLYRMPDDGPVERVSADRHDFMGFTVAGPDRFLASGHPGIGTAAFQELDRPLFGLIESTDGGRTWEPVSLSGEVDFHALQAAHGNVYGFDSTSGQLLVSTDGGSTWDPRSSIPIGDLAVDPADGDHIVVSTAEGLAESTDGGRSWELVDGPSLVFLGWHAERGLWGLDGGGTVHHLDGDRWEAVEELAGSPQALLVHDGGVVVSVDDGSTVIHTSDDGEDWAVLYRDDADH
jgi:hypothetical protein